MNCCCGVKTMIAGVKETFESPSVLVEVTLCDSLRSMALSRAVGYVCNDDS